MCGRCFFRLSDALGDERYYYCCSTILIVYLRANEYDRYMRKTYCVSYLTAFLVVLCLFISQACAMRGGTPLLSSFPREEVGDVSSMEIAQAMPGGSPYSSPYGMPPTMSQPPAAAYGGYPSQGGGYPSPSYPSHQPYTTQQQQPSSQPYFPSGSQVQHAPRVMGGGQVSSQTHVMEEAQQCVEIAMEMNDTAYYLQASQKNGPFFTPILQSNLAFLKKVFSQFRCNRWYGYNEQYGSNTQSPAGKYDYHTYMNVDGY